jgi:hypothetical protein
MEVEVETNQILNPNRNRSQILILILIRDYFLDRSLLTIPVKKIQKLRVVHPSLQLIHALKILLQKDVNQIQIL